jgi:DNA-binding LacI/PurR family transcriptional regulator
MAATLKDVAARAGVSIPTANQVLNGFEDRFAVETCERVRAAATALNYETNIAARAMREGKTYLIGVLYSGVNNSRIAEVLAGLQEVAWEQSYVPILLTHDSREREKKNSEALLRRRVDGLLINPWIDEDGTVNSGLFDQLLGRKFPLVEIFGRNVKGVPSVNVDNRAAGRMAVQRLVERGHKSIAHFTHARYDVAQQIPGLHFNAWELQKGYEDEMRANGLTPVTVTHEVPEDLLHSGYAYGRAFEAAPHLLQHPSKPTAVICMSEEETEGLMHYVIRHAQAAPPGFEAVTLVGPNVLGKNVFTTHCLQLPIREIGAAAAKGLLEAIHGKPGKDILLPPRWIDSSAGDRITAGTSARNGAKK